MGSFLGFSLLQSVRANSVLDIHVSFVVDGIRDNQEEEFVVPRVDEVLDILKSDFENVYFVTGVQSVKVEIDGNKLVVDLLSVDSIEGHNREPGKGFPTTEPRVEAGNVVIHRRLHATRPLVVACVLSGIEIVCRWTLEFTVRYVVVIGLDIDHGVWSGKDGCWGMTVVDGLVWTEGTRLICASFGSTRLICASFGSTRVKCASFGSTRLICASLGITRLIDVSFGITRLICAFYGTTRLLCKGTVRGRPTRGRKDA
ncbi:hypothetical protein E6C27_scaffold75G001220 [Cucumis melo var. makuwa]|uniref:Uncharacterized protein n=1 Tax=Cucumis melo var. makuwa TaxID=1194695 RepID=A0A5A7TI88_CUCMM|nr:hypothetical protein E6C27_scaffold75G001220 [Cucumis melo var. makuwa]